MDSYQQILMLCSIARGDLDRSEAISNGQKLAWMTSSIVRVLPILHKLSEI
jgi:hypothetical protein